MTRNQVRVKRHSGRLVRGAAIGASALAFAALTACSGQAARLGLPEPASAEAPNMSNLWIGAWIASFIVGGLVWGLIGWAVIRYRHKEGDRPIPRQTKYHLPLELLYTLVPFLIISVLFFYTVKAQDALVEQHGDADVTINVVAQRWSWTFNYMEADNPAIGSVAHEGGTTESMPDLYLPIDKKVRINLRSADVIHSFWVPSFYFKLDVIPGHPNSFDVTPNRLGTYDGKCAELCGEFHSRMLFNLHIVSEDEYNAHVKQLVDSGNAGEVKVPPSTADTLPTAGAQEEHP